MFIPSRRCLFSHSELTEVNAVNAEGKHDNVCVHLEFKYLCLFIAKPSELQFHKLEMSKNSQAKE
jgi:hypothetical protein